MTNKEMKAKEKIILHERTKIWNAGKRWEEAASEELKQLAKEISAVGMINSILVYSYPYRFKEITAEQILEQDKNSYYSYLNDHVKALGKKRVLELIREQQRDLVSVRIDVCRDSEGCSYNSATYVDEVTNS